MITLWSHAVMWWACAVIRIRNDVTNDLIEGVANVKEHMVMISPAHHVTWIQDLLEPKMAEAVPSDHGSDCKGKPSELDVDNVKYLLSLGFSKSKVAGILGISRKALSYVYVQSCWHCRFYRINMHRMTSQLQCVSNSKGGIAILKISIAIHNRNAHMTGMCIDITFWEAYVRIPIKDRSYSIYIYIYYVYVMCIPPIRKHHHHTVQVAKQVLICMCAH